MSRKPTFSVNRAASDDEYLTVKVKRLGTVQIKAQPDGIIVDVYSPHDDEPIAGTWAHISDLLPYERQRHAR